MPALPSGVAPRPPVYGPPAPPRPVQVLPPPNPPHLVPARRGAPGFYTQVAVLVSTPVSRGDGSSETVIIVGTTTGSGADGSSGTQQTTVAIGQTADQQNSSVIVTFFTTMFNRNSQDSVNGLTAQQNARALSNNSANVHCSGTANPLTDGVDGVVDCLKNLLAGNLLDLDAKKMLCGFIRDSERAVKRAADRSGNAILNAAHSVIESRAAIDVLRALDKQLSSIDPGALAACVGGQHLKSFVHGQLKTAANKIAAAQHGAFDKLAKKFNAANKLASSLSAVPDFCSK